MPVHKGPGGWYYGSQGPFSKARAEEIRKLAHVKKRKKEKRKKK